MEGRSDVRRRWGREEPSEVALHGVMQAVSTFTHHEGIVRGMARSERNMLRAVTGEVDALDRATVSRILQIAA